MCCQNIIVSISARATQHESFSQEDLLLRTIRIPADTITARLPDDKGGGSKGEDTPAAQRLCVPSCSCLPICLRHRWHGQEQAKGEAQARRLVRQLGLGGE